MTNFKFDKSEKSSNLMNRIIFFVLLFALFIIAGLIGSGCDNPPTADPVAESFMDSHTKVPSGEGCILSITVNGYNTEGLDAWIEYNHEINCYVLNIRQKECGESVPLTGENLFITIYPK